MDNFFKFSFCTENISKITYDRYIKPFTRNEPNNAKSTVNLEIVIFNPKCPHHCMFN